MSEEDVKYRLKYNFQNPVGTMIRAYLRQHQFETRFTYHVIESVEQVDDDTVKVVNRYDFYSSIFPLRETVYIKRNEMKLESSLTSDSRPEVVQQKDVLEDAGNGSTEFSRLLIALGGNRDFKINAFKNTVLDLAMTLKAEHWM